LNGVYISATFTWCLGLSSVFSSFVSSRVCEARHPGGRVPTRFLKAGRGGWRLAARAPPAFADTPPRGEGLTPPGRKAGAGPADFQSAAPTENRYVFQLLGNHM